MRAGLTNATIAVDMRDGTDRFVRSRLSMNMPRSSFAILVALVGCTDASAPVPMPAAPVEDAPPVVADAPVTAVAHEENAPVVAPPPDVVAPPTPAPASPLPDGPIPAFVIAGETETIVAPIDAALTPDHAPGIWVLDDAVVPPVVRFDPGASESLPYCECDRAVACSGPAVVDGSAGPICECRGHETSAEESCEEAEPWPVALVGGALYFRVDTHDLCEGMNIYDVESYTSAMVATPSTIAATKLKAGGCIPDDMELGPLWPLEDDCGEGSFKSACDDCDEIQTDAELWAIHAGRLWKFEDETDTVGTAKRKWSSAALTPASCPSAADTCGPRKKFRGLDEATDFWIANDGAHALRVDDGALTILGGAKPLPRGDAGTIIGVRWHADARALIVAMRERAPRPITVCGAKGGHGTQCVEHMRAKRFVEAKAACEAGLAATTKPSARGALLYNLGRIAQLQGDLATARTRYRESLEARPKNKTVKKALASLPPE